MVAFTLRAVRFKTVTAGAGGRLGPLACRGTKTGGKVVLASDVAMTNMGAGTGELHLVNGIVDMAGF